MKRILTFAVVAVFLVAGSLQPQAPQAPPKPAPELKRLAYFVGTWKSEGEMKPSGFGPGGKFTSTDTAKWMQGRFFLVTNSDGIGPLGPGKETSYMGYDPNEKVYTFHLFNSMGENVSAKGKVQGDTWTWNSEEKMGGNTIGVRFTIKEVSPTEYTFKMEMSQNAGPWSTVGEGKTTKVAAKK